MDKPRIERVTDHEVYLLAEDGIRTKRICGKVRENIPEEFPCVRNAGEGTSHFNIGFCKEHDTGIELKPKSKNTYEILITPENKSKFLDYLVTVSSSESEHHTSVDSEIELLESIVLTMVDKYTKGDTLTLKQGDDLSKIVQKLANVKKIKIEALKKEKLDSEIVAKFLSGILGIIKMHTQGETTKRIVADIMSNVVVPMMNRDEMTRTDVKDFKKMALIE